jgi:hypothetical protein
MPDPIHLFGLYVTVTVKLTTLAEYFPFLRSYHTRIERQRSGSILLSIQTPISFEELRRGS